MANDSTDNPIKALIAHLDAATARAVLASIADKLGKGEAVVAADLQAHLTSEVQKGAAAALSNPWRAAKIILVTSAITFLLGGATALVLFCRHAA